MAFLPAKCHLVLLEKPGKLDNHTDKGKLVYVSLYAIEETKFIISEDGLMDFRVDATKKDGTFQYYRAVYKRA